VRLPFLAVASTPSGTAAPRRFVLRHAWHSAAQPGQDIIGSQRGGLRRRHRRRDDGAFLAARDGNCHGSPPFVSFSML
jgi:hypothetical protein